MEEREEILDYLEENVRFFKNVDKEAFNLLRKKKISSIEEYSIVTPLLKQISEYALVIEVIDDLEIDEISELYDDLGEILAICNNCSYLIGILIDEKYKHPSINNYVNSVNGIFLREKIFSMVYSIVDKFMVPDIDDIEEYEDDYDSDVIDREDNDDKDMKINSIISLRNDIMLIEEPTNELLDFLFKYVLFSSKEKNLNEVGILKCLVSYSNMKIKIIMLISDYKFSLYDTKNPGILLNSISEENVFPTFEFNYAHMISTLSDMFIDLEQLLACNISNSNFSKINRLKEAYHLYQSYRYSYLKNSDEEGKLLNKCKRV